MDKVVDLMTPRQLETAKLIGGLGCAWLFLHFMSYLLLSPLFDQLLEANPATAGNKKKKARAITQMLPRVVCFVHNVIQVPLALAILTDPYFLKDKALAKDDFSSLVMAISGGYFLYDTLECIVHYSSEGPEFLLHGVVCLLVYVLLTYRGVMHWFGAGFLMWELSTPFMHFRWFLFKVGKDKTALYTYNNKAGFLIFALCRMVWGPVLTAVFWVVSWYTLRDPDKGHLLPLPLVNFWRVCSVILNCLNTYWFMKMVQIALGRSSTDKQGKQHIEKTA